MGKPLIMVSSVTYAMKARDLLFTRGIKAYIERIPRAENSVGCGYGLYVPENMEQAEQILHENGIKIIGHVMRDETI